MSELGGISTLKEGHRTALQALLSGKDVEASFPAGFGKSLV